MARRKRTSAVLEAAQQRLAGLKSITPAPDFGPNLKLADFEAQINDFSDKLNNYNQLNSTLDDLQNQIDDDEIKLRETNRRMLSATEAQYGPDSSQLEQAGGTRDSERKRSPKKPKS